MLNKIRDNIGSIYLSAGIVLALFGFLSGTTRLWSVDLNSTGIAGKWFIGIGFIAALYGFFVSKDKSTTLEPKLNPLGAAFILPLLFFVDFLSRSYGFFPSDSFRGELLICGFLIFWLTRRSFNGIIRFLPPIAVIILTIAFLIQAKGKILLFDDHASFFYRLEMLRQNFPNIPHYNPLWNTGIDARDYFSTGVLNVFAIFAPLIYLIPLEHLYNFIIIGILFILLPLASYYGARFSGHKKNPALLTAFMALVSSLLWYRWGLKYGAIGFCTSAILFPLNVGLTIRLLDPDKEFSKWQAFLFGFSFLLMCFWSLSAIAFLPLILLVLKNIRIVWQKKYARLIALGFFIIYIPWAATFLTVSKVGKFISLGNQSGASSASYVNPSGAAPEIESPKRDVADPWSGKMSFLAVRAKAEIVSWKDIVRHLRDVTIMTNPLILFLAIPGISLLARRAFWPYLSLIGWNVFLAIIIAPSKPQLELDRMYLIATLLLALPTSLSLNYIFERAHNNGVVYRLASVVTGSFLLFSLFSTTAIVHSRREEQYFFTDDNFFKVGQSIKELSGGGRALFPGFMLHDLSRAHIAPLIFLSDAPLVASYPFHQVWWYTEQVPKYYLDRGIEGVEQYFDTMNADLLVVREPYWIQFLNDNPDYYLFRRMHNNFLIYERRKAVTTYTLEGQADILEQTSNSVRVSMKSPTAVIKFNYFPFLEAKGCTLSNKPLPGDIHLIEIKNCQPGQSEVLIKAVPAYRRVLEEIVGLFK
jgi:hypothetical protein